MQATSLKALSRAVLDRNQDRNCNATKQESHRNFDPRNDPEKLHELSVPNPAQRFCYWRQAEVNDCHLPCWTWSKDTGDGRTCTHFRAYMVSIGRWTPQGL